MLDDEGNDALEVNGDNFMHTVMKMNKAQEIITNGKTEPKKSASNKKKKIVENGIGIIHVDEEMVKSKSNKKMKVKKEAKKESGSVEDGQKCFEWMIDPITKDNFFKDTWEKKPLHIKRNGNQQYYKHIFSTKSFDEILRSQVIFTNFCFILKNFTNFFSILKYFTIIFFRFFHTTIKVKFLSKNLILTKNEFFTQIFF